ncbi:CRISPR-associated helicase Cas3' [Auritidibacter ignavus]|uniref:CRISPR-associated helicase Cas3' n=1 Tax=Auritidibacter ignavus TaxID=678932 RepID=UPI0024BB4D8B|nr:CRISPR-associated helicase Cas3' [Auritidibacter ignavus]WHS29191.1 CRISPR-associated helicase Cas3' [Auritidibacter ignavus]
MNASQVQWSAHSRALWAKTGDADAGTWMNLPRHMMDSAAVAEYLWDSWLAPGIKDLLSTSTGLNLSRLRQLTTFLAGVHDLGKADPVFQTQILGRQDGQDYIDRLVEQGFMLDYPEANEDKYPHSTGSFYGLMSQLSSHGGLAMGEGPLLDSAVLAVAEIVGAHHGLPVSARQESRAKAFAPARDAQWVRVQQEMIENIAEITGFDLSSGLPDEPDSLGAPQQMLLTALVIMSDWIASNQFFFPLSPPDEQTSEHRRNEAIAKLALTEAVPAKAFPDDVVAGYQQRFAWPPERKPRNAQRAVVKIARDIQGPKLITLEADTGSGKTEAALAAAETLAAQTGRSGVMVAAPTMATSDALFRRVRRWAQSFVGVDGVASLYLGHSKNYLNPDAEELAQKQRHLTAIGVDSNSTNKDSHTSLAETPENVIAHQWLHGRKKGILSNFVVGTVDQVLMMGLQSKHAMLRHLGIASKVVIIDEVHSYTSYMNSYLSRVLMWLGAYGTPVVLLSATLPHEVKAQLMASYRQGLTGKPVDPASVTSSGDSYPVVTVAHKDDIEVFPVHQENSPGRALEFESLGERLNALGEVMDQVAEHGGCLLVLCNTVTRAQEAYRLARAKVGDHAELLHARFIAAHRVLKEQNLVDALGPSETGRQGRPDRLIVVATQVVEQSLDVDFDALVTDIAPMDLIIQRVGRVHRHERPVGDRPEWSRKLKIGIRGLEVDGDESKPPVFEATQELIYHKALLMNTWALLQNRGGTHRPLVSLPDDIPDLVAQTYGSSCLGPGSWAEGFEQAREDFLSAKEVAQAKAKAFMFDPPLSKTSFRDLWTTQTADIENNAVSEEAGLAQVRDTEPSLEVCLTRKVNEASYELITEVFGDEFDPVFHGMTPDEDCARAIAASSIRLPHVFSNWHLFDRALTELEGATDQAWQDSPVLRGQLQLNLDERNRTELCGRQLRYDIDLGLVDDTAQARNGREENDG